MHDQDPLWYDREEPPYSWNETWIELGIMVAGAISASIIHFSIGAIMQQVNP